MNKDELPHAIAKARIVLENEWVSKVPGLSVAVAINSESVWSEAFGFADLENKVPATPATRFRIGSVSKPLTAAGLALLIERGLFDLDAPIQKYIPDFPQKDGLITPRLLAGHLTGIRNYRGTEAFSSKTFASLRDGLKIFENDPLEAAPGTRFMYASYNWNVLGAAMEAAANQDFLAYIDSSVINPLKLSNTVPDTGRKNSQQTEFYENDGQGRRFVGPPVNFSHAWPAGGYLSTAEDMAAFGSAHLRPGFLKPASLKLLFTPQKTSDGKPTPYCIGWFVGKGTWHHGGDSVGGTAVLLLVPSLRIVVAIASNGGRSILGNAVRKGQATDKAKQLLFEPKVTAHKIAAIFARAVKREFGA